MSDEQKPAPQDSGAPTETAAPKSEPSKPATEPKPEPRTAAKPEDGKEPHWLKDRLERERAGVLRALGIESVDAAKAALADYQAKLDAEKTAAQKAADAKAEAEKAQQRVSVLEGTIAKRVEYEMAQLTEAQREAVAAIAGDDGASLLKAIDTLRPTWATVPAQSQQSTAPAADKPQPATTAPPRDAPGDGGATSPPDHKAVYQRLKSENPVKASHYLQRHLPDIYPSS